MPFSGVSENDGETHAEAVQRNIGENAVISVKELADEFDKVRAQLAMFRKICRFNVKLTPAGAVVANYAKDNCEALGIRNYKEIAALLQISDAALTKYGT